jgi:hypothetical protein
MDNSIGTTSKASLNQNKSIIGNNIDINNSNSSNNNNNNNNQINRLAKPLYLQRLERALRLDNLLRQVETTLNDNRFLSFKIIIYLFLI